MVLRIKAIIPFSPNHRKLMNRLYLQQHRIFSLGGNQSWRVSVTESFRSEIFSVTRPAVNFFIGTIASQCRVQRPMASGAIEADLVPHLYSTLIN